MTLTHTCPECGTEVTFPLLRVTHVSAPKENAVVVFYKIPVMPVHLCPKGVNDE